MDIGYCTNVHGATSLDETLANLGRHAVDVRDRLGMTEPMGVGLWLSASAAAEASVDHAKRKALRQFLDDQGLCPFTLNGFPFGDFHRPVVKHDVYFPTWWDPRRAEYTLQLIDLLCDLLPDDHAGSISTLPISWGYPAPSLSEWHAAARQLMRVARHLASVEQSTGRHIVLALEPEPGCALERARDVVELFERHLWPLDRPLAQRYLGVCHDVCHAVVMFESQREVLDLYRSAGIRIGKAQISSAVQMRLDGQCSSDRCAAVAQLAQFTEERYLHQTMVELPGEPARFFEDLPLALGYQTGAEPAAGKWHVHFHVPVYLERFGHLSSSRDAIEDCVRHCLTHDLTSQFEIETYAWGVLPPDLRVATLADGIAREMNWFRSLIGRIPREHGG